MREQERQIIASALQYNQSISPRLKELTEPLFKNFGFNHFCYSKMLNGKRFSSLSVNAEYTKSFLDAKLDRYVIFEELIIPKNAKRVVVWDVARNNELLDLLRDFDFCHGISFYKRHQDVVESWHFASSHNNEGIKQFYLNHIDIIENFIIYFNTVAQDIISHEDLSKFSIYTEGRSLDLNKMDKNVLHKLNDEFKNSLKWGRFPFEVGSQTTVLSKMELLCLREYVSGKSAKELAREFQTSPRTIETHVNNIKMKLNISNRTMLRECYENNIYNNFSFL